MIMRVENKLKLTESESITPVPQGIGNESVLQPCLGALLSSSTHRRIVSCDTEDTETRCALGTLRLHTE